MSPGGGQNFSKWQPLNENDGSGMGEVKGSCMRFLVTELIGFGNELYMGVRKIEELNLGWLRFLSWATGWMDIPFNKRKKNGGPLLKVLDYG